MTERLAAVANDCIEAQAVLDPIWATGHGIAGHNHEMRDFSPDQQSETVHQYRQVIQRVESLGELDGSERVAADFMCATLRAEIEHREAGEELMPLRLIGGAIGPLRFAFDLIPKETDDDWADVASRLSAVPEALEGIKGSLAKGSASRLIAARRQVVAVQEQCATYGGLDGPGYFQQMLATNNPPEASAQRLAALAQAAETALLDFRGYLSTEYLPKAPARDAVGRDRYERAMKRMLGAELDPIETYEWGWDEFRRIESQMKVLAGQIVPGASIAEAATALDNDDSQALYGEAELLSFLQDLLDTTVADMNGTHFDIPDRMLHVEAMIAPPGGAAAMYYTGPSEDFVRPGRTWYPTMGRTRFPIWREVSTCHHEGVPGHHLQVGLTMTLGDQLNRFQKITFNSAHGEGWALYSERLMEELGYYEEQPAWRLGMLQLGLFRAARVIVDIGMHLELKIPESSHFHAGEVWSFEHAVEFMATRAHLNQMSPDSEITRYLGWPAQAITYKLGERTWLDARETVKQRHGSAFSLKAFHHSALELGPLGLDQLSQEMARI